ncbi:MAG: UDP-3-O-[3-hydroxymyristoyl] N-acetylglucosamine deacetylase [Deltaproteobacteria bacterium RIFCSPLOWO2_12_FULL_43_16]|nr:MAG: UDP-3-O-[3-hydroxymyristoyl] N-acetylglucosamine deacetylase [Deltaproteobacteria bacterium RIFCSPHIGHO2_02_FULL_43_33]OGQ61399.1 MAG: UDP-3-O-[3-hydroxymyristoyl] N-acetylglucosamine deacetylase [Deltaproteobacteria bacterium RIFCSPLOWO2_12_FULL_43_16]HBR17140.1 UDP-3-O-[3-hydroxymyristoyl] N-acetylglucosamine deacetylase [Deltaproteobacteria bacterium]
MQTEKKILIVDDEDSIRQSLSDVLKDEGFEVLLASNGQEALKALDAKLPDLIILDIWMPIMDGTEVLKEIKAKYPELKVIMISGHGNIEAAVKAIKLGAYDYIEKPLSLEGVLLTVKRAFGESGIRSLTQNAPIEGQESETIGQQRNGETEKRRNGDSHSPIPRFPDSPIRMHSRQRTIKRSVVLGGQGLHSGGKTGVILSPLPPNSGIIFTGLSSEEMIPAHLDYVSSTDYATTLKRGHASIMTIEHLMAVLHVYRITNLLIKIDREVPIMDGSATYFCQMLEDGGIAEQNEPLDEIVIKELYIIGNAANGRYISIEPSPNLTVEYSMEYPQPIGRQMASFTLNDPEVFKKEIAPARTYGSIKDYGKLEEMGLAKGGRLSNVVLVDEEKVINTSLRFTNEFARHKILDITGDLYLLGRPIKGKVVARMTGHTENILLLRKIAEFQK